MPIYEYSCRKCARPFEALVFNASEVVTCPGCGSREIEKRFSVFGVGSGDGGTAGCEVPAAAQCAPGGCARPDCGAFANN